MKTPSPFNSSRKRHSPKSPPRRRRPYGLAAEYQISQAETIFPTNSQMLSLLTGVATVVSALTIVKRGWGGAGRLAHKSLRRWLSPHLERLADDLFLLRYEDRLLARRPIRNAMLSGLLTRLAKEKQPVLVLVVEPDDRQPIIVKKLTGPLDQRGDTFHVAGAGERLDFTITEISTFFIAHDRPCLVIRA